MNGWNVDGSTTGKIVAGKKARCNLAFFYVLSKAEVASIEDTNNTPNTSDIRFKKDIAPLRASWLLERVEAIRYYLTEEGASGKLRFGLRANGGAGGVQEAIRGTDIDGCNLLDDSDPSHLNLNYTDMIAVLVEGWQRQQAEIAALKARAAAQEERIDRLERLVNELRGVR